jgi:hypothetical protein
MKLAPDKPVTVLWILEKLQTGVLISAILCVDRRRGIHSPNVDIFLLVTALF